MKFWFTLVLILFAFSSCKHESEKVVPLPKEEKVKEYIQKTNKENVAIEDQQIDDYLNRRNWEFVRTESGIRYNFYKRGMGLHPKKEQRVVLEYSLSLIRGEQVYSSKNEGPMIFTVDHEDVPAGINEFVKLMKPGDKAMLVVPSYLGFGVMGDGDKIPERATLIYDVELTRILD